MICVTQVEPGTPFEKNTYYLLILKNGQVILAFLQDWMQQERVTSNFRESYSWDSIAECHILEKLV